MNSLVVIKMCLWMVHTNFRMAVTSGERRNGHEQRFMIFHISERAAVLKKYCEYSHPRYPEWKRTSLGTWSKHPPNACFPVITSLIRRLPSKILSLFPGGKDLIIIQLSMVESYRSKHLLKTPLLGIPCSSVVRTQCFHCQSLGSVPGRGTRIPQAAWHSQK